MCRKQNILQAKQVQQNKERRKMWVTLSFFVVVVVVVVVDIFTYIDKKMWHKNAKEMIEFDTELSFQKDSYIQLKKSSYQKQWHTCSCEQTVQLY